MKNKLTEITTNKTMYKRYSKEKTTKKHKKREQNEIKERDIQNVFQCTNQGIID